MTKDGRPSPFSFRLKPDLRAWLENIATRENRRLGNVVDTILRGSAHIKAEQEREAKRGARR